MSEDEPQFGTREWVRYHWDEEEDNASKKVILVKLIHEYHIAIPGLVVGLASATAFWYFGAGPTEILSALFGGIGGGYALLYESWWCSTLVE